MRSERNGHNHDENSNGELSFTGYGFRRSVYTFVIVSGQGLAGSEGLANKGKGQVLKLLSYSPEPCPLNASVDKRYTKDGLMIEHVSYDQPFGPRTEGILLYPIGAKGKLPGVVALHDHGGFKYYGKEKLVDLDDEPDILTEFKRENYDSTSWATKLAKQGYVVFVPDIFLWGSRKLAVDDVPETFVQQVLSKTPGSRAYIEAYNDFSEAI